MDVLACKLYTKISKINKDDELKKFWSSIASEEREHVLFWKKAIDFKKNNTIPDIFYDIDTVILELKNSLNKANNLFDSLCIEENNTNYFLTAYWMEFYLLYPSFITLFHYIGIISSEDVFDHVYEKHLLTFVDGFSRFGKSTPEMALLGSLLHNLWKRNNELVSSNMYDGLTELMNRKGISDTMISFASLAQRNSYQISIMMVDIDNFKQINDVYGHQTGDKVLKNVANTIKGSLRKSDLVGRFGGEEFLVFLVNSGEQETYEIAEKMRINIENKCSSLCKVTVSIGCLSRDNLRVEIEEEINEMLKIADDRLYQAKRSGKNKVIGF